MKKERRIAQKLACRKQRIQARLQRAQETRFARFRPVLNTSGMKYELAEKSQAITYGGVPLLLRLAQDVGLVDAIDEGLPIFKKRAGYHESDHVFNLALNALCEGTCLQHIERRRNDEVWLNAIGAVSIPDPTTAGDFCRRFSEFSVRRLLDLINKSRRNVWRRQAADFFKLAKVDADGTFTLTTGECKAGMDINYKGQWGYHPLVVSLANTGEVLSVLNRPGNRPSHEGAAAEFDRAIALCREAGFKQVLLRGDTDFSQTAHLDRWHEQGDVRFQFGYDARPNLIARADELPQSAWSPLKRPSRYTVATKPRGKPRNVKKAIVRQREFKNLVLQEEQVAEFEYQPTACQRPYRMIVLRKKVATEKGVQHLFDQFVDFFYITNDRTSTAAEVVFSCNDRCNQENLHAQLADGVRALTAPVNSLNANWAYMVMTSLAWTLKAWAALWLPIAPEHRVEHEAARDTWLRMEFKTFANEVLKIPSQIVQQGRRVIHRLLNYTPQLPTFFRLAAVLRC